MSTSPTSPTSAVTIVSGFLGSGKTTLLRRVVSDPNLGPRVAVLVNELGALGLDEELIASSRSTATLHVQQLVSGCLCCTLKGELSDALRELSTPASGLPPEHILVETSGAARVTEVAFAVQAAALGAPFHAEAVITVVDAANAWRHFREHAEPSAAELEHRALFADQLEKADLVLLNKSDRMPDLDERALLEGRVRALAPHARTVWTDHADVSPTLLLGSDSGFGSGSGLWGSVLASSAKAALTPGHGFAAVSLPVAEAVDRTALEDWLEALSATVYRIKGIVDVTRDGHRATVLVQAVGDSIEVDELDEESLLHDSPRRLLFIGVDPDRAALEAGIRALTSR